jgi:CheY-like chemotaxis protein
MVLDAIACSRYHLGDVRRSTHLGRGPATRLTVVRVSKNQKETYRVLVVDDSDDDRFFLRRSIQSDSRLTIVAEVCNGEDAIAYLSGRTVFSDREKFPFPDLMLLDLKMPRKNGYEVLQWLRTQKFERLVVVVLSGSTLPEDAAKCRALGADAYKMKSAREDERNLLVREIESLTDRKRRR